MMIIGYYFSRKINTPRSFFLADRSLKTFPLTATITATVVGGSATIATGALIYTSGLPGLWLDIGGAVGLIVLGFTLATLVRKTKLYTLPEITGKLFDEKVRFVAAILVVLTQIAWIALLIQATGAILYVVLPLEYQTLLVIITAIFVIYTFMGGQFAVVYTDLIQFLTMLVGVCFIAAPILLLENVSSWDQISSGHLSFPVNNDIGVLTILSFFFMMMMPHIVGPDIYNKILSAKDEKTAKYSTILAGIFKLIFAIAIGIIALVSIILYPDLSNSALAVPKAVLSLSPVLAGIILAAFVSIMLSSADSVLLSSGTVISIDLLHNKNIYFSRISMGIIGIFSLILALYLNNIIDTLKLAYTIFTSGLTLPIIFGFYREKTKVTSRSALLSLISGGVTSLIWLAIGSPYIDAVLIGLIASILPLLIFRENGIRIKNNR
jgi:SSS family solute:Na+ symporter